MRTAQKFDENGIFCVSQRQKKNNKIKQKIKTSNTPNHTKRKEEQNPRVPDMPKHKFHCCHHSNNNNNNNNNKTYIEKKNTIELLKKQQQQYHH